MSSSGKNHFVIITMKYTLRSPFESCCIYNNSNHSKWNTNCFWAASTVPIEMAAANEVFCEISIA